MDIVTLVCSLEAERQVGKQLKKLALAKLHSNFKPATYQKFGRLQGDSSTSSLQSTLLVYNSPYLLDRRHKSWVGRQ